MFSFFIAWLSSNEKSVLFLAETYKSEPNAKSRDTRILPTLPYPQTSTLAFQSVISVLLIARLIAPIMSYTAEEIWGFLPHSSEDNAESIFLNQMPEKSGVDFTDEFVQKWDFIYGIREAVNKVLEEMLANGKIEEIAQKYN